MRMSMLPLWLAKLVECMPSSLFGGGSPTGFIFIDLTFCAYEHAIFMA